MKLRLRLVILAGLVLFVAGAAAAQQFDPRLYAEMQWRCIGPFRGGRTVAVTGVPKQPNVFYMAAVNGGIWKTTDFGNTWAPIFEGQDTSSIGALAVAHSNPDVIYAGSGEGLQRPDLAVGDGMYRSSDAGKTWMHLGLGDAQQITAIVVDPGNSERVFVSVLGHPYGPNPTRGVFRSKDGGKTWERMLYQDDNTGAADLLMDPSNPQTLYAVLWAARVAPWEVRSGASINGPGSGLFKSTDGGDNWVPLTNGLPTFADGLGRMGIAISLTDPKRLYASVEAKKNPGIYRSDDAGQTWERMNGDRRVGGGGPGAMGIAVSPDDPNLVYVANVVSWRSSDGGKTFTALKGAPGGDDYQRVWVSPENSRIIALTSDQGTVISVNRGETWSSWYNQPTAQFYHVTTDNRFPYWVYGAQQESGSAAVMSRSDYGEISFRDWHPVGVFEYGTIAVDPRDANKVYGARLTRTDQALGEVAEIGPEPVWRGEYRYDRTLPVVFSPFAPGTLFFAANVLFRTTDEGRSWTVISPDLAREKYDVPANLGIFTALDPEKGRHRGVIYAVAPSFKEPGTIWAGTDDGLVHLTRDGGKNWWDITPKELTAWSKVSNIEASHFDAGTAYMAVNRFRLDDLRPYIYRTRDFGKTWQSITEGLPGNAPVNVVREDPLHKGLLFAGTETSVYVSFDDGENWQPLQLNLPHTSMRDLALHGDDLIVATHGRSFWILDDITPLRQISAEMAAAGAYLFEPQTALRVRWNRNTDTPLPPETPAGKNPPDGAMIDYFLKTAAEGPVTLEILDPQGHLVRRFSSADKPAGIEEMARNKPVPLYWVRPTQALSAQAGMHRFIWDLHYPRPAALETEFPISAIVHDTPLYPLGAWAPPGLYTVKLTVNGKSYTRPLALRMDPRITSSLADLGKQFEMQSACVAGMDESYAALREVQELRAQLKESMARLSKGKRQLAASAAALDRKAAALEGATVPGFAGVPPAGVQPENLSTLNQHFGALLNIADSFDGAPTTQAAALFAELQRAQKDLLARWQELKKGEAAAVGAQLKKAKTGFVFPAPADGKTR